ncbi:MAG: hypothetical protein KatS3mg009_1907 [Acidimicrobiia bacterium]|nr:MAG: hypothetical protein KatS3mg009_1907 [Acidimicrobiia bacterium]
MTRALRSAIARITEALPDAGRALDRAVRTGTFCAFEPDRADGIRFRFVRSRVNGTPPR